MKYLHSEICYIDCFFNVFEEFKKKEVISEVERQNK